MSENYQSLRNILSSSSDLEKVKRSIRTFVDDRIREIETRSLREPEWFDIVVKIANTLVRCLENLFPIPSIITTFFGALFDIAFKLIQGDIFNKLVQYNLILQLKIAVQKLKRSLEYMLGALSEINSKNQRSWFGFFVGKGVKKRKKRISILDRSTFNIHTARDEIEYLKTEVERTSSSKYLTDSMMEKVELYCFVSLLLELCYLLAIELEKKCHQSSTEFADALESLRSSDERLLSFLYKPNVNTLKLFLKYTFEMKWPLVNTFLQSRELVVDNFTKDHLKNHVFQIVNADDQTIRLSLHYCLFFFCMRAHRNTNGRKTYFKIECQENGVNLRCSLHDDYLVSNHYWTGADKDTPGSNGVNVHWFLVKVDRQQGTGAGSDCFVIVPKSTETGCLYFDFTGRVHDKDYNPRDDRCFWRLQPVDASMFYRLNMPQCTPSVDD